MKDATHRGGPDCKIWNAEVDELRLENAYLRGYLAALEATSVAPTTNEVSPTDGR